MKWGGCCLVGLWAVSACGPTTARTNARLEKGFEFGISAAARTTDKGFEINHEGMRTNGVQQNFELHHLNLNLQWAWKEQNGAGFAVQGRLTMGVFPTALDLYYALPGGDDSSFAAGFGAELGALPAVYGVFTRDLGDRLFVTFTPRVLLNRGNAKRALLNPQISFGLEDGFGFAGFVSYVYYTGAGYDPYGILGFDSSEYHKQFLLTGLAASF